MHRLFLATLFIAVTACTQQQMDGWGFPQGRMDAQSQTTAEPLQGHENFETRLQEISQKLSEPAPIWESPQSQVLQPANARTPVDKTDLGALTGTKVALLVPMSGSQAALGQSMLIAGQMAVNDLKANHIELLPRDSGTTPAEASKATKQAIAEGAKLILGPIFSAQVRTSQRDAAQAGVPMIAFTTHASAADQNTFVMGFLPSQQVARIMDFAVSRGAKNMVVLTPENDYGTAVAEQAAHYGGLAVGVVKDNAAEPERLVARVAATLSPRTAILFAYDGKTTVKLVQAFEKGAVTRDKTLMLGTGLLDDPSLAQDRALENVFFASAPLQLRERFKKQYVGLTGKQPERLASLAYDAVALSAVIGGDTKGSTTPYPPSALRNPNGFSGMDGVFRFGPDGRVQRQLSVLTWKAGQLYEVFKAEKSF